MLTQYLVQNSLIYDYSTDTVDWSKAAPIIDLNTYVLSQDIQGIQYFRAIQKPWTEVEVNDLTLLQVHQYGIDSTNRTVARVKDGVGGVIYLSPNVSSYILNEQNGKLVLDHTLNYPLFLRRGVSGLNDTYLVDLPTSSDTNLVFDIAPKQVVFSATNINTQEHIHLQLTTDSFLGRIRDADNNVVEHIPVTLIRTWEPQIRGFHYQISIANHNYPAGWKLELY